MLFMFSPRTNRRILLVALVLAAASQLPGCATPDVICDVRQDYHSTAIPPKGEVRVTWEVKALPANRYGYATCDRAGKNCHIQLADLPDFNNVCRLADFGHELAHAMGAQHQ
jgi:hypothetical protein